jgi:hypothetical protein
MYATNVLLRLSGKIAMDQDGSTPEVRITFLFFFSSSLLDFQT